MHHTNTTSVLEYRRLLFLTMLLVWYWIMQNFHISPKLCTPYSVCSNDQKVKDNCGVCTGKGWVKTQEIHSETPSIVGKLISFKSYEKWSDTLCVEKVHRVQRCIRYFCHVWCHSVKSSSVLETVYRTRPWRLVWHRKIRKYIFKHILAIYLKTRCQTVFDSEHSLHL
jgi:hypothetical protein